MRFFALLIAVILFVVAALGVGAKLGIDLVDLGLACFAVSFLIPGEVVWPVRRTP